MDDAWDDLAGFPTIEICQWHCQYPVGENCLVPLDTEELVEAQDPDIQHVFETTCMDDNVIITMDLDDGLPTYVLRFHPDGNHFVELRPDPNDTAEDDGCRVYTIITDEDLDPEKVAVENGDDYRRALLESGLG